MIYKAHKFPGSLVELIQMLWDLMKEMRLRVMAAWKLGSWSILGGVLRTQPASCLADCGS